MSGPPVIVLAAINRTVTLRAYVDAVKLAKASPETTFKHGLDTWWPTTGAEIRRQYRRAVHDRINQAIPWNVRTGGRGKRQMQAAIADAMTDIRTNAGKYREAARHARARDEGVATSSSSIGASGSEPRQSRHPGRLRPVRRPTPPARRTTP